MDKYEKILELIIMTARILRDGGDDALDDPAVKTYLKGSIQAAFKEAEPATITPPGVVPDRVKNVNKI